MIRHPGLLRVAYRRFRHAQVADVAVPLPAELHSDMPLQRAQRGLYGVFPQGLNQDETAVAQQLDASPLVHWWHRNPVRRPESVALYRWDDGEGFYPDFVVAMTQRNTHGQIALLEVKGLICGGAAGGRKSGCGPSGVWPGVYRGPTAR